MTLLEACDWLRRNGAEVATAGERGDLHAVRVMRCYWGAYHAQFSSDQRAQERANASLIACLHEFIVRDLKIDSRRELHDRYGYKEAL